MMMMMMIIIIIIIIIIMLISIRSIIQSLYALTSNKR